MEPLSNTHWTYTPAAKLLGTRYPIIQGPFGGGLSSTSLAAAVSNAGGLGSFGAHLLRPEQIRDTVAEMRSLTQKPFALNFWVPQAGEPRDLEPAAFAKHVGGAAECRSGQRSPRRGARGGTRCRDRSNARTTFGQWVSSRVGI